MSRIDYSKWDNIEDSSSDEEEQPGPLVTRLDEPSRIVTSQGQEGFAVVPLEASKSYTTSTAKPPSTSIPAAWTKKGGIAKLHDENVTIYWSQDRYTVTLRVPAPKQLKLEVQVEGILSYTDRNCAATTSFLPKLTVRDKSKAVVWWQGDLPHAVHLAQDEEEDVDWSVERHNEEPYLTILLAKATPMEGVFVWWKRPLLLCPETEWRNENEVSSSFQLAWKEAHEQFQTNVTNKEKTVI